MEKEVFTPQADQLAKRSTLEPQFYCTYVCVETAEGLLKQISEMYGHGRHDDFRSTDFASVRSKYTSSVRQTHMHAVVLRRLGSSLRWSVARISCSDVTELAYLSVASCFSF